MHKQYKVKESTFAVIIPMANEACHFVPLIKGLKTVFDKLRNGHAFFVVDKVSVDNTLELCTTLSETDNRFKTVYEPLNKNVVDAYLRGFREACKNDYSYIIEMDAGLAHDPVEIPKILLLLEFGYECVFGSRFTKGGAIENAGLKRLFFSKGGTHIANLLLGTNLKDMTSGYQGFHTDVVRKLLTQKILSTGHFYQTEIRYLLRKKHFIEHPINYLTSSQRLPIKSVLNAIGTLQYYIVKRITFNSPSL